MRTSLRLVTAALVATVVTAGPAAAAPEDETVGGEQLGSTGVLGVGVGLTAYMLGVRHAFDADHIASIDNTTRKLVGEGKPSLGVGFWFSLGHSSVVFGAAALIAFGVEAVSGTARDENSTMAVTLGLVGSIVAGTFLVIIGLTNLASVVGIVRVFRGIRTQGLDEHELEHHLHSRGFIARLLSGATRKVTKPWHVYPVGLLMGLGFDTASQVALLVLAAWTAASPLPWFAILVLPVLFAAGMSLFDTLDGAFMNLAYDWALANPLRRLAYNGVVTAVSVAVALGIGTIQLVGVAHEEFGLGDAVTTWIAGLDTQYVGYAVAALFLLVWIGALLWWRARRSARTDS